GLFTRRPLRGEPPSALTVRRKASPKVLLPGTKLRAPSADVDPGSTGAAGAPRPPDVSGGSGEIEPSATPDHIAERSPPLRWIVGPALCLEPRSGIADVPRVLALD